MIIIGIFIGFAIGVFVMPLFYVNQDNSDLKIMRKAMRQK